MGMRTALIVGSAPCVKADLDAARVLRPEADVIAVKFSVAIVHARIAVTHHAEHAERMKAIHRERWGDEVEIHMPKRKVVERFLPFIDKTWPQLLCTGGTSAWGAARIARLIGYEEVILCGCPLEAARHGDFYHDEEILEVATGAGASRYRGEPFANDHAVRSYQRFIESDAVLGYAAGVKSMSGWTRKHLGAPDGR
jgi:hypothetical protein